MVYLDEFPAATSTWLMENRLESFWRAVGSDKRLTHGIVVGKQAAVSTYCDGFGDMLGGYDVLGADGAVGKNFSLDNVQHTHIRLQFTLYTIDSWDNEHIKVYLDGMEVLSVQMHHEDHEIYACGMAKYPELVQLVHVDVPHTSQHAQVQIRSTLDGAATDESWGIQGLSLSVLTSQSPPPATPPFQPQGGSTLELTGTAPKITFGPPGAPSCMLSLNSFESRLESTCDIITGRRRLNEDKSYWLSMSEVALLKAEVTELRHMVTELMATASK